MTFSKLHIKKKGSIFLLLIFLSTGFHSYPQEGGKIVKAERGDGIYTLLKRYGLPDSCFTEFIALNKSLLGSGNSLYAGRKYRLPEIDPAETPPAATAGSVITENLFGENYKNVSILSNELKGATYYLSPGHGGPDPGAMGTYGDNTLCEDEYAYDVTLRLARNLMERGAKVYLITQDPNDGIRDEQFLKPDKDEVCYQNKTIPLSQTQRLRQRTEIINRLYLKNRKQFQRVIEVHVDSRSRKEDIDVFFYYDNRSTEGHSAAVTLLNTFNEKYKQNRPGRGYEGSVSERNLYMLKYTYPPAVYIELGNINHERDQKRFIVTDNRQALANWLRDGLIKDYEKYK
jgi:N-acetylmuramoyl-L-alanine amidase